MSARSSRPPAVAERIVAALSHGSPWKETTLGDLSEEHAGVAARRGRVIAAVWYWGQTIAIVVSTVAGVAADAWRAGIKTLRTGDSPMRVLLTEFRFAVRTLVRQPLMALAVIATMALGLGANAAAFSMLNELVFRPFPFPGVDRLTMLSEHSARDPFPRESVAPANFLDWRRQADRFDRMVAYGFSDMNLSGPFEATRVHGFQVSGEFFDTMQVQPASGRLLDAGDDVDGKGRVVVLGDALWKRTFGGRSDVIGQAVRLDDAPYTVVGIAPSGFEFPQGAEFWVPLAMDAPTAAVRNERYLTVIARLRPGASLDDATAQMGVIGARLRQQYPVDNRDHLPRVQTLTLGMIDPGMPQILAMIQVGAVVVLLIGGANIVNLLLARGCDRQREIAVRLAIGGSRWQVIRQLLVESLVLAAVAVPVALVLAQVGLDALKGTMPPQIVRFVPGW
jgi:putative ABC transport system permease protein